MLDSPGIGAPYVPTRSKKKRGVHFKQGKKKLVGVLRHLLALAAHTLAHYTSQLQQQALIRRQRKHVR
jgi:hypothetical protein